MRNEELLNLSDMGAGIWNGALRRYGKRLAFSFQRGAPTKRLYNDALLPQLLTPHYIYGAKRSTKCLHP